MKITVKIDGETHTFEAVDRREMGRVVGLVTRLLTAAMRTLPTPHHRR